MNKEEYETQALLLYQKTPILKTPEGQKFNIGDVVRIANPESWFAKEYTQDHLFKVEYSYWQKYGGSEKQKQTYSLQHLFEDNSSSWYDESELELVNQLS